MSNTAGALSYDTKAQMASELQKTTGVTVLSHRVKKPGCGSEIMEYFHKHPETGVSSPSQVAIVGDRLFTDMMLANTMGSYGLWIKDGVVPLQQKSIVRALSQHCSICVLALTVVLVLKDGAEAWPISPRSRLPTSESGKPIRMTWVALEIAASCPIDLPFDSVGCCNLSVLS